MDKNQVKYNREDIIKFLGDLNVIVVSLDRIGSSFAENDEAHNNALASFIIEWDVTRKLAKGRQILSDAFSNDLGDDDMEELEREFQDLQYWSVNNPIPPQ